jgi:hypothetical protein
MEIGRKEGLEKWMKRCEENLRTKEGHLETWLWTLCIG